MIKMTKEQGKKKAALPRAFSRQKTSVFSVVVSAHTKREKREENEISRIRKNKMKRIKLK